MEPFRGRMIAMTTADGESIMAVTVMEEETCHITRMDLDPARAVVKPDPTWLGQMVAGIHWDGVVQEIWVQAL